MSEYPKSPTDRVLVEWQGTFLQVIQNWLCVGKEAIENLWWVAKKGPIFFFHLFEKRFFFFLYVGKRKVQKNSPARSRQLG